MLTERVLTAQPHMTPPLTATSPQKGKSKERQNWQLGWWDFQPLTEQSTRPVEWSPSSVIFCAHPTQPLVTARHFSSSRQFTIPSPSPIVSSPVSYGPPSVISVAPTDTWLFAYFPGLNIEGIGCLWTRGWGIDSWNVKDWWNMPQGAGAVAATWLGSPREWFVCVPGVSNRLPARGPRTPVSSPSLLLVTEDLHVTIFYYRHYSLSLKSLSCSIAQVAIDSETSVHPTGDTNSFGSRRCCRAAIGLGYNESSILIATRSYYTPPSSQFTSYLNVNSKPSEHSNVLPSAQMQPLGWENWGEEKTIDLCEVQLRFSGTIALTAEPLPSILDCNAALNDLRFLNFLPSLNAQTSPSQRINLSEQGQFYLISSCLDFNDYASFPISEVIVHSIVRQQIQQSSNSLKYTWKYNKLATRNFAPSVVTFVSHFAPLSNSCVYACIIHTSGSSTENSSQNARSPMGVIKVLNLSDLSDNDDYEPSVIFSDTNRLGLDLPMNAISSPNGTLLCTISSSLVPSRTVVQSLPALRNVKQTTQFASSLASAVISGRSAMDVNRAYSVVSMPVSELFDGLDHAYTILDGHRDGLVPSLTLEFLGKILTIYRMRSIYVKHQDKHYWIERWKTAHDICSLAACNRAFEDCQDGGTYDLDAVWQLIGLVTWVITFSEKVFRDLVVACSSISETELESSNPVPTGDPAKWNQILDAPILLHICQPFALARFVTAIEHVQNYRAYIGSLSPRGENAQIAQDTLKDLVNGCGIDFAALKAALSSTLDKARTIDSNSCRRALVMCQPTPTMYTHIIKMIHELTKSNILIKPLLFIKPYDLVDGVSRFTSSLRKDKNEDVLSKQNLTGGQLEMICLQCGGATTSMDNHNTSLVGSSRWLAWERQQTQRCICGGNWISDSD